MKVGRKSMRYYGRISVKQLRANRRETLEEIRKVKEKWATVTFGEAMTFYHWAYVTYGKIVDIPIINRKLLSVWMNGQPLLSAQMVNMLYYYEIQQHTSKV